MLGREPVSVDLASISTTSRTRSCFVTGAGGSIGSEPAVRSRASAPKLVLLDNAEPALFEIERDLSATASSPQRPWSAT